MSDTTTPHRASGDRRFEMRVRMIGRGGAAAVGEARHQVGEALCDLPATTRDTAALLSGEIVTNAVIHGGGRFLLEVHTSAKAVRVEVTDSSAERPRLLGPSEDRDYGRGMAIVDALADRWGTTRSAAGKVVWFELDVSRVVGPGPSTPSLRASA